MPRPPRRHAGWMPSLAVVLCLGLLDLCGLLPNAKTLAQINGDDERIVFPFVPTLEKRIKLVDPARTDVVYPIELNNWWGLMNRGGQIIVYPQFDWTDYAWFGVSRAIHQGKTGYIMGNGAWYIEPIYPWADRFAESYAVVGDGKGKYGFINRAGKPITPMQFDGALRFSEKYAAFRVNDRCGFINAAGQVAIDPAYARVRSFTDGLAMVQKRRPDGMLGPVGYINKAGKYVWQDVSGKLNDLGQMRDGMARLRVGDQWGFMNRAFKLTIPLQFEDARDFYHGLAAVREGDTWGYINKTGQWVIPPQFEEAYDFRDGQTLLVRGPNGYGYINRIGDILLPLRCEWAYSFFRKYGRVGLDENEFAYVMISGRPIWDPRLASRGLVDARRAETIRAVLSTLVPYNRVAALPPPRKPYDVPYVPEFLYEPVLPQPER